MPGQVDAMPANDVYMILYARRAEYINRKWKDAKKQPTENDQDARAAFERAGDH